MAVQLKNNAVTTLAADITSSATSISVTDGSVFPTLSGSDYTYATFEDTNSNREIVKVTAISSNTLTVVRAQDNTTARAFSDGDKCELRITAALLNDIATQADTDTNTEYTAGSGITLTGTVFSNAAPDQTVALTGAGTTTISGTYPNFTITGATSNTSIDTMTGDGTTTALTLSSAPATENQTAVYIDGVYQSKSNYSVSGTTLTFSTAPPNGSAVEVALDVTASIGAPSDGTVTSAKLSGDLTTPGDLDVAGVLSVTANVPRVDLMESDTTDENVSLRVNGGALIVETRTDAGVAGADRFRAESNGDISFYDNAGNQKFFWDSSAESLGIGTDSPNSYSGYTTLTLNHATNGSLIDFELNGTLVGEVYTQDANTFAQQAVGARALAFRTNSTERLKISSSGAVGIGISNPTEKLTVVNSSSGIVGRFTNNINQTLDLGVVSGSGAAGGVYYNSANSGYHRFQVGGSTKLIIDGSGRVGIGTTSPSATGWGSANPVLQLSGTQPLLSLKDTDTGEFQIANTQQALYFWDSAASSTRMVIDASGNLMVGKTTSAIATEGTFIGGGSNNGLVEITRDGSVPLRVNRTTNHGQMIRCDKDGVIHGRMGTGGSYFYLAGGTAGSTHSGIRFVNNGSQRPCTSTGGNLDNTVTWGASVARWEEIFVVNGTINTSDRNEKQDIEALSDAEQRVAVAAKGLMRKYRWRNAVAAKGDDARIHFGIIAQDLQDAFTAEGLDAARYAMWCSDTFWVDSEGETYDTQEEAPEGATEKTRLGVRYSELLAFIIAAI